MSRHAPPFSETAFTEVVAAPAIEPGLNAELQHHKGRWVAVDQATSRVIAAGGSAEEVVHTALAKRVTDPLVLRVPTHPERPNFL
jgi:hypothetical protein